MEHVAQAPENNEVAMRTEIGPGPSEQALPGEATAEAGGDQSLAALLAEQEAKLAEAEAQVARERELNRDAQRELQHLKQELALALGKYRTALLAGAPDVPEELVQGQTVAELDEAFGRAKALVERLRRQLEAAARRERVPAGAPARQAPDLSALTPHQKILLGLQRRTE